MTNETPLRTSYRLIVVLGPLVACVGCIISVAPDGENEGGCRSNMECSGTPFRVPGVPALSAISAGAYHTCGLAGDGTAWCWGSTTGTGEAGAGTAAAIVPGEFRFITIGSGRYHNCALAEDGIAYCWSSGPAGGMLCGPIGCGENPVPVGTHAFRALTVGEQHTCALDESGAAFCWGFNWMGEAGSTRFGQTERNPVRVSSELVFAEISANHGYTCALTLEGAPYCWGWAEVGQLGVELAELPVCSQGSAGDVTCSASPLAAATTTRLTGLSAGWMHACALNFQHQAICWGDNGQGQLGDDLYGVRFVPGPTTDRTWSLIEAGGATTCGTAMSGGTFCWGLNHSGLLGSGSSLELSTKPHQVAGGHTFAAITAGLTHTCGFVGDGTAYCWGDNTALQLGGR